MDHEIAHKLVEPWETDLNGQLQDSQLQDAIEPAHLAWLCDCGFATHTISEATSVNDEYHICSLAYRQ